MVHVAIITKKTGFVDKILAGQKTIETRWYKKRILPWGKIKKGEKIYFKETNGLVRAQAAVKKVIEVSDLTPVMISSLLDTHSDKIGITDKRSFYKNVRDRRYAILIFLSNPKPVKPFSLFIKGRSPRSGWQIGKTLSEFRH
jgi:ASC-1-like (ASCH) protein